MAEKRSRGRGPVSRLSPTELDSITNDVLRSLIGRQAESVAEPIGPHDKHTSQHGRNTIVEEMVEGEFE
jgi:hypothetical protein